MLPNPQTQTPSPDSASARFDARQRLEALRDEFKTELAAAPRAPAEPQRSVTFRRVGKTAAAAAMVVVLGWMPINRLMVTSSAEATVNARLITLRAPIDGSIHDLSMATESGDPQSGSILKIANVRADRSHLDDLQRIVDQAEAEVATLRQRKALLTPMLRAMRQQTEAYRAARVAQLIARSAELRAQIAAGEAQVSEANAALRRAAALLPAGYLSDANYKKSERDFKVITETVNAARSRGQAVEIELASARNGVFVGDSYNDAPQSAQRAMDLDLQIGELAIQLSAVERRLSNARGSLDTEKRAFDHRSAAEIALPKHGRLWERLVSAGEEVKHGQELMRVLDCGQAVVTATVSEGNYNRLSIGDPAKFTFRNGSEQLEGWITALNGLAAVPGNFAIDQRAMSREPFHVTVFVPELARAHDCGIGRSGRVVFTQHASQTFAGGLLGPTYR